MLALAFSSDGRYLITGGDSPVGEALGPVRAAGELVAGCHLLGPVGACGTSPASRSVPDTPNRWSPDTATARCTSGAVVGSAVKVHWSFRHLVAGEFTTAVKCVCFTSDGQLPGRGRRR